MGKVKIRPAVLPKQQLFILAICRFAEPVALTSVFPYLPEMIESFNIPTDQVAKWAGLTSACFSFSQCLTGIAWGRASDQFGRKPAILVGLCCTMVSSLLFGFSKNLVWAFVARSFAGLSNGNVGIMRTCVAEMVPQRELQPRAFSVMPLVWTIGSILGPAFGGALVHPAQRYPATFGGSIVLKKFPFSLPNLVGAILFLVGLTAGLLFLEETLQERKHRKDYGLMLGSALTRSCNRRPRKRQGRWGLSEHDEAEPFLHTRLASSEVPSKLSTHAGNFRLPTTTRSTYKPPSYREVFSCQSSINLMTYTLLAMHSVAYDQLLPIFMHHPVNTTEPPYSFAFPLRFSSGFGLSSPRIGLIFTIYGFFGMFIQFAIFPPLARRYGVLNCLHAVSLTFPLIYFFTPFTTLLPTSATRQGAMMALMLVKCWCVIFAFPCSTILLTNSAGSLRLLGTLNGVATSVSAVGRAVGPTLGGALFTVGVNAGYVVLPWWTLCGIACLGSVPVWWLVEMEGPGKNSADSDSNGGCENDSESGDETDDEDIHDQEESSSTARTPATPH